MIQALSDLENIVADLVKASHIAGLEIEKNDIRIEYLPSPHERPSSLPDSFQSVYGFILSDICLKVGKAGPNSDARYTSQHYNPNSSNSNLASSLINSPQILAGKVPDEMYNQITQLDEEKVQDWMIQNLSRFNILIDQKHRNYELSFIESFMQCRLDPIFEG